MRIAQSFIIMIVAGVVVWRGLIPAFTQLDSDFPNYYTAARIVLEGKDVARLYDDKWFQDRMNEYGISQEGKFWPFPPVTALLMTPLAWMPPLQALRVWTIINLAVMWLIVFLLSKISGRTWQFCLLIMLLSGHALINDFRLGQFHLILTFLIVIAFQKWQTSERSLSGISLGIGAAVKYFPVVYLPSLIARREWKIVGLCLFTIILLSLSIIAVLGVEVHKQFLSSVLLDHLSANMQQPFSASFQSWDILLKRLFIFDRQFNQHPVFESNLMYGILKYVVISVITAVTAWGFIRAKENFGSKADLVRFALLGVAGLLLAPATATYHFLLLVPSIVFLLSIGQGAMEVEQKILTVLFTLLSFIPYSVFRQFDGNGILTLLAYPRLYLLTALFTTSIMFIVRRRAEGTEHPSSFS